MANLLLFEATCICISYKNIIYKPVHSWVMLSLDFIYFGFSLSGKASWMEEIQFPFW